MHWQNIPVTIRRNKRSRRVLLKVRATEGVEVVLPFRVSVREVPSILERNRQWLNETIATMLSRGEGPGQGLEPDCIRFKLNGQEYAVRYVDDHASALLADDSALIVRRSSVSHGAALLQRWLVAEAKKILIPLCRQEAARLAIRIGRVQVRNQQSCWGSCSRLGTISLNAKLLFLPHSLVLHVIRHELCHVAHRNHGPDFWSDLEILDPQAKRNDQLLKEAWLSVPAWARRRPRIDEI